jgi:two-component system sensor histidine kinase PilS (NtrC family)
LIGGISNETGRTYLNVIDHGPGIDPETAQNIFDPFFTTEAKGSGLGLYITKELCEANNARITYTPAPNGGSCFSIEFARMDAT